MHNLGWDVQIDSFTEPNTVLGRAVNFQNSYIDFLIFNGRKTEMVLVIYFFGQKEFFFLQKQLWKNKLLFCSPVVHV